MSNRVFRFYMDDSGSRDPDKAYAGHENNQDWFALGGVIIDEARLPVSEKIFASFRSKWPETKKYPLRSYEIRNRKGNFRWLAEAPAERKVQFMEDITALFVSLPVHILACVIDRPGYNKRYLTPYGQRRWKLCRTAFNIAVERAVKFARFNDAKLKVYVERSDRPTENQFRAYYDQMREQGLPFDDSNSAKYEPLSADNLRETLYDFQVKTKESELMQIADVALWPVCKGGYDSGERAYRMLNESGKLLDSLCTDENGLAGIKYSCF